MKYYIVVLFCVLTCGIASAQFFSSPYQGTNFLGKNLNNALDFDLVKSVGEYFKLSQSEMEIIMKEVFTALTYWKEIAKEIGISRAEQEMMAPAFRVYHV